MATQTEIVALINNFLKATAIPNASWNVPHWFVDPSNSSGHASDSNDGATALTPLLHYNEIIRRWGSFTPTLAQDTLVTAMSDSPDFTDPFVVTPNVVPASGVGVFTLEGTPTQIGAGSFSAVTPKNRATGQRWQVTVAGPPNFWAPFVGMLLHDTTADAWCWVTADLGGGSALLSEPLQAASFLNSVPAMVPIAALDAFVIFQPTKIYCPVFAPTTESGTTSLLHRMWLASPAPFGFIGFGSCFPVECRLDGFVTDGLATGDLFIVNSEFLQGALLSQATILGGSIASTGGFSIVQGGSVTLDGDAIVDPLGCNLQGELVVGTVYFGVNAGIEIPNINNLGGGQGNMILSNGVDYGLAFLWGPAGLNVHTGGLFQLSGSTYAAALLQTGGLTLDGAGTASAYDIATGLWHPGRALTPANLDLAVAGGGFGGVAYGVNGDRIARVS